GPDADSHVANPGRFAPGVTVAGEACLGHRGIPARGSFGLQSNPRSPQIHRNTRHRPGYLPVGDGAVLPRGPGARRLPIRPGNPVSDVKLH
ncbi:unnamed protein product, partial [Ascophyllum nodosum]